MSKSAFSIFAAYGGRQHAYTKTDDGLTQRWADRTWVNPPYSDIAPWTQKAWEEFNARHASVIAMLLPAIKTEQPWWQRDVEAYRDQPHETCPLRTHFLPGRTAFARPGSGGVGQDGAPFGCVLLVWRRT